MSYIALLQSLLAISGNPSLVATPVVQEPVAELRSTLLPLFVANPSPFVGKLLHTQFPEIEVGTLLEIVQHNLSLMIYSSWLCELMIRPT